MALTHRLSNTGTIQTATYFDENSQFGSGSLQFSGSSLLALPANTALYLGSSNSYTIESWVYLTAYAASPYVATIFSNLTTTTSGVYFNIGGTASSYTDIQIAGLTGASNFTTAITAPYNFNLNTWYHVAVVVNSGVPAMYVNGISQTLSGSAAAGWTETNSPALGGTQLSAARYYFPGYISNFRIVKGSAVYTSNFIPRTSALTNISNTSILMTTLNYNPFIDYSNNHFTIPTTGPTSSTLTPFSKSPRYTANNIIGQLDEVSFNNSGSLKFDGSTGYLSVPNTNIGPISGNAFTIEGWFNLTGYQTTSPYDACIFSTFATSGTADGFLFNFNGTASSWTGFNLWANQGITINQTAAYAFSLNTWYHIAITKTLAGVWTIYVNGNNIFTYTATGTWPDYSPYTIGRDNYTNHYPFPGLISNFRLNIGTPLYSANFARPQIALTNVANTKILLPAFQYLPFNDASGNNNTITVTGSVTSNTLTPLSQPSIRMSNTGRISILRSGQFDEYTLTANNIAFYSDGTSLSGWTNSGITISSSVGNPANSFSSTGSSQYAYINPNGITSFVGKTIKIDMLASGATPLIDFYFGCAATGSGQMFRLECRSQPFGNGIGATSTWTSFSAPSGTTSTLTANVWHTIKIQIYSTAVGGMKIYIDGTLIGTGTFVDNGGYMGLQGDGGTGGNWDNIYIYNTIV